jgi:CheY-like chemotaxis protein
MKILIIDRDRDNCDQMRAILEGAGAEVTVEPIKNKAQQMLRQDSFDVTLLDPTPQNEMRPFIMGVRRSMGTFPPILIMAHNLSEQQVLEAGGNALVRKPVEKDDLLKKAQSAQRIAEISRLMADEKEDFRSKDGIIAKSAFNQLFITCLDRADRHGEQSYLIFIEIANLRDIAAAEGNPEAAKVADNLRKNISRARRTSDIAGHIKHAQFCLLLLRPQREDEPFLAASRFAEALKADYDLISTAKTRAILKVWLLAIPSGDIPAEHMIGQDA